MAYTKSGMKATNKYISKSCKKVAFLLNKEKDKDIIEKLGQEDSMSAYIKRLIREDIEKQTKKDYSE